MSWQKINSNELQAVRRLLCLDVSDAAQHIGKVSNRTWQYWEAGRSNVPEDVNNKMYELVSQRTEIIEAVLKEIEYGDIGTLKWYHTLDAFQADFINANDVLWRLHQSVCAYFFTDGGNVSLCSDALIDSNSFLYKWFAGTTEEQLEYVRQERIFEEKLNENVR